MGFWDDTYGFLSNVGTVRAHVGLWIAYAVAALLVLAVPIALVLRAFGPKTAAAAAAVPKPASKQAAAGEMWRDFQNGKPAALLASFACCVLTAVIIVVLSRWSLQATQKYKPYAALGGVDLVLDIFGGRQ